MSIQFLIYVIVIGLILEIIFLVEKNNSNKKDYHNYMNRIKRYLKENAITISDEFKWESSLHQRNYYVVIDNKEQYLYIFKINEEEKPKQKRIAFEDILDFEVYINRSKKVNVSRAVVGGTIGGEAGAILGGISDSDRIESLDAVLFIDDDNQPEYYFSFINTETSINNTNYKNAITFINKMQIIIKRIILRNQRNK